MGNKSKQKGFSFLEIAVVLSVIGLMMAAIMTTGRMMILLCECWYNDTVGCLYGVGIAT